MPIVYAIIDILFVIFHTALILFNLFGWIWKKTRKANLITLLLTGASWFILGIFYGIGYCPMTDWHWEVLEKLGKSGLPNSYITYLIHRLTGLTSNEQWVDAITVGLFFLALSISLYMNLFRKRNRR
ncbi:MAG: DUF2784 domain-containing protein [Bacteroidales bacterium]|nr:DUF2784 domain-containing protein [Bacteroidales bacterium]